ncbi:hypothetical protein GCM10025734_64160 [Kitasatospora paranensis]|uniref:hypothetical protein n=1 Tax=Kitasatospora paranensis TaxID=258053 RepID=UPI0031E7B198
MLAQPGPVQYEVWPDGTSPWTWPRYPAAAASAWALESSTATPTVTALLPEV